MKKYPNPVANMSKGLDEAVKKYPNPVEAARRFEKEIRQRHWDLLEREKKQIAKDHWKKAKEGLLGRIRERQQSKELD